MLNRILATLTLLVLIGSGFGLWYFYDVYSAAAEQQQREQRELLEAVNVMQQTASGAFATQGQTAKLLQWAPVSQGARAGRFFREYHLEYILNTQHMCLAMQVSYQEHKPQIDSTVWMPVTENCL